MDRQRRQPRGGMMQQAIVTPTDNASIHSHSHSHSHPHTTTTSATMSTTTTTIPTTGTTKACVECMRRKIRCNGRLPCDKCIYYEVPICQYRPRKQRKPKPSTAARVSPIATVASPTSSASASASANANHTNRQTQSATATAAEALVARLFPGQDPAALMCLPPHTLLGLVRDVVLGEEGEGDHDDQNNSDDHNNNANDKDDNADDNEGGRGWHEFRLYNYHDNNDDQGVCDDVNGLSINIHRRSYLGIGSIQAIFRAMFRVKPSLQWELQRAISLRSNANMRNMRATEAVPVAPSATTGSPSSISTSAGTAHAAPPAPPLEEETAINAYFAHIHGIVPLLDEVHFRDLWRRGQRCDRPWLALLNMVLVLGSLAFGDERSSHIYYLRAQTYLDFELLATGCLESLQALCLLGGLYLHLRNAPNMAYTVMGMAYRIAIGLGLHRMPGLSAGGGKDKDSSGSGGPWRPQIRQRIWWSLFCLDTWGSMNLGRPTLGRWDTRAMTVPRLVSGMQTDTSDTLNTPDPLDLSLDCASAFCLVATKIQQRLAQPAPMRTDEVLLFDAQVQSWHRSLPPVLLHADQCPTPLRSAQRILRYRYFNLRMLLLRSVLIRYAHGRAGSANGSGASPASLSQPDQQAVSLCRDIACEAVEQIHLSVASSSEEGDAANRILVWSAVWYLYQATMVLLLSIMVDPDHPESLRWRASVETALVLLGSATPVSRAADRSRLLVQSLLHICGGNSAAVTNVAGNAETADETMESVTATAPIFTFPAYPALSPSNTMSTMGNHQPGAHPGAHPGSLSGMNAMTGIPGNMSDEDLWSLLGLDMFTEETSTWGVNELGDWPVTDYNHGQFGA